MRAALYKGYGPPDVLEIRDVACPIPGADEILIRVRAASVNPADWHVMRGKPYVLRLLFGLRRPKVRPGIDVAGAVEAVGGGVTRFKPGDAVFGVCTGAFAEYACTSTSRVVSKPDSVTFEQAASLPVAALTALQGLRDKGNIQPGHRVLINGASGGVGTFAVQIAKSFGADVTGVCSTRNVEMVRSIGADHVIDYTQQNFTSLGQRYDIIFDCIVNHPLAAYRRVLNPNGICVIPGAPKELSTIGLVGFVIAPWVLSRFVSQKFVVFIAKASAQDLTTIGELLQAGKVTPVIDKRYGLSEVAEAIRYLEEGHARGKVLITLLQT
jgi:NADPH:quinone reductase-like Zn-dependent oxidoreductase